MKKLINNPYAYVDETISGILKAHPRHLKQAGEGGRVLVRSDAPVKGKVGIVTGGGSGHLPLFLGYVGPGLADAVAIGNVFSAPSTEDALTATRAVNGGAGVLHLFGNYMGDTMAFRLAAKKAIAEGIPVETVTGTDDIISAPPEAASKRRGIAGIFFPYKLAGAKAETGASLAEVAEVARQAVANTRTMGVALSACTIPAVGSPNFSLGDDEMELGMGIHGEPGLERGKLLTAKETATILSERILADLPFQSGDRVAILVNGLGATPPEELYILFDTVHDIFQAAGVTIVKTFVGEYATSMEMAGCSVSAIRLDAAMEDLLAKPYHSPFLPQGGQQ